MEALLQRRHLTLLDALRACSLTYLHGGIFSMISRARTRAPVYAREGGSKDSNRALQFGQCQRWRMTLSSKSSVLWGAMISRLHRTQRIPNMNIEGRLFIVLSLCHAGPYRTPD